MTSALASVFSRDVNFESSTGTVTKFCRNFRGFSTAAGLLDFLPALLVSKESPQHSVSTASLNAKRLGGADLMLAPAALRDDLSTVLGPGVSGDEIALWRGSLGDGTRLRAVARHFFQASIHRRDGQVNAAFDAIGGCDPTAAVNPARGAMSALATDLALELGESADAIAQPSIKLGTRHMGASSGYIHVLGAPVCDLGNVSKSSLRLRPERRCRLSPLSYSSSTTSGELAISSCANRKRQTVTAAGASWRLRVGWMRWWWRGWTS